LGTDSSTEFCKILLNETGVSLLSGGYFNTSDRGLNARLAFVDFDGAASLHEVQRYPFWESNQPRIGTNKYNMEFLDKHAPNCVQGIDKMCSFFDYLRQ
jgi:aspartate aminotransferase